MLYLLRDRFLNILEYIGKFYWVFCCGLAGQTTWKYAFSYLSLENETPESLVKIVFACNHFPDSKEPIASRNDWYIVSLETMLNYSNTWVVTDEVSGEWRLKGDLSHGPVTCSMASWRLLGTLGTNTATEESRHSSTNKGSLMQWVEKVLVNKFEQSIGGEGVSNPGYLWRLFLIYVFSLKKEKY